MRSRFVVALLLAGCSSGASNAGMDAQAPDSRSLYEIAMVARQGLEPRFRAQFRADLGAAFARASNAAQAAIELSAAQEEANQLTDPSDRDRVLGRVGRGYLALGDRAKAREVASKIGGPDERGELLGELAEDQAQALAIPTPGERDRALARLAIQDATAGNLDRAGLMVAKISDENLRPPVMGAIITGMLNAGRTVDATRLMGNLDGLAKSEGGAAYALWASAKGDLKTSRKWNKMIESELIRARTLAEDAVTKPIGSPERKRLADEALRVALDLASGDLRNGAIEAVARAFADNVDPVTASLVLETALAEPVRNQPGLVALAPAGARRVRTLVATSWAATGAVDQATRHAEAIDDTLMAAEAWTAIARAAVARGNVEPALAASSRIIHDELRLPVAALIAAAPAPAEITASMRAAMAAAIVRDANGVKR